MTRLCKTVCALFLLIGLCSILVAASAQADPDALAITELSISSDSGKQRSADDFPEQRKRQH